LESDLGIIDSAFAVLAFGRACEGCAVFELDLNDGIERERVETAVILRSRAMLSYRRVVY